MPNPSTVFARKITVPIKPGLRNYSDLPLEIPYNPAQDVTKLGLWINEKIVSNCSLMSEENRKKFKAKYFLMTLNEKDEKRHIPPEHIATLESYSKHFGNRFVVRTFPAEDTNLHVLAEEALEIVRLALEKRNSLTDAKAAKLSGYQKQSSYLNNELRRSIPLTRFLDFLNELAVDQSLITIVKDVAHEHTRLAALLEPVAPICTVDCNGEMIMNGPQALLYTFQSVACGIDWDFDGSEMKPVVDKIKEPVLDMLITYARFQEGKLITKKQIDQYIDNLQYILLRHGYMIPKINIFEKYSNYNQELPLETFKKEWEDYGLPDEVRISGPSVSVHQACIIFTCGTILQFFPLMYDDIAMRVADALGCKVPLQFREENVRKYRGLVAGKFHAGRYEALGMQVVHVNLDDEADAAPETVQMEETSEQKKSKIVAELLKVAKSQGSNLKEAVQAQEQETEPNGSENSEKHKIPSILTWKSVNPLYKKLQKRAERRAVLERHNKHNQGIQRLSTRSIQLQIENSKIEDEEDEVPKSRIKFFPKKLLTDPKLCDELVNGMGLEVSYVHNLEEAIRLWREAEQEIESKRNAQELSKKSQKSEPSAGNKSEQELKSKPAQEAHDTPTKPNMSNSGYNVQAKTPEVTKSSTNPKFEQKNPSTPKDSGAKITVTQEDEINLNIQLEGLSTHHLKPSDAPNVPTSSEESHVCHECTQSQNEQLLLKAQLKSTEARLDECGEMEKKMMNLKKEFMMELNESAGLIEELNKTKHEVDVLKETNNDLKMKVLNEQQKNINLQQENAMLKQKFETIQLKFALEKSQMENQLLRKQLALQNLAGTRSTSSVSDFDMPSKPSSPANSVTSIVFQEATPTTKFYCPICKVECQIAKMALICGRCGHPTHAECWENCTESQGECDDMNELCGYCKGKMDVTND